MANVIDYVKTQFDTFEQRPFCAVDSLALSFLAYITIPKELEPAMTWEGMRIADLYRAEHFASYYAGLWAEVSGLEILCAMAASPRFRDVKLARFVEKIEQTPQMQFSAMTFLLPDGLTYVAFKGTDATIVGWKEDFNLSFQWPVPSQVEAVAYLTEAAAHCSGPLRMGGHSKGGNLAVFASSMCEADVNARIERVYSHDGPGFLDDFMQTPGYLSVRSRIDKTVPQSSVIGLLMKGSPYRIVQSDALGLWQHDPSTWLVEDCDFVWADGLTSDAVYVDSTISDWLRSCTREEREIFVNALYSVVEESDALTFADFTNDLPTLLVAMTRALLAMDAEKKALAGHMIRNLVSLGVKNVPELFGVYDVPVVKSLMEVREAVYAAREAEAKAGAEDQGAEQA